MQFSVFQNKIAFVKRGGWAHYYKSFVMLKKLDKFLKMKSLHFLGEREWITYCGEKKGTGSKNLKRKGNPKRFHQYTIRGKVPYFGITVAGIIFGNCGKRTCQEHSSGEYYRFWLRNIRSVTIK